MKLYQATIKRINNLINENSEIQNYNQLANRAGLNESVVRALLSGQTKNPTSETIYYICIAFHISIAEFYNDPLFDINNIDDN